MNPDAEGSIAILADPHNPSEAMLAGALAASSPKFRVVASTTPVADGALEALLAFRAEDLAPYEDQEGLRLWLFLPHFMTRLWPEAAGRLDGLVCPSEAVAWRARNHFPHVSVETVGLVAHPALGRAWNREETRRKLGVPEGALVVFCREETRALAEAMDAVLEDARFFVVVKEHLSVLDAADPAQAAAQALAASDLVVAEPHLAACSEALAAGVPLVAFATPEHPEFQNALALVERNAAQIAQDLSDLLYHLDQLARDARRLARLKEGAADGQGLCDAEALAQTLLQPRREPATVVSAGPSRLTSATARFLRLTATL